MGYKNISERKAYAKRYHAAHREIVRARAKKWRISHTIERICLSCLTPFGALISEVNRGNGVYCSRNCRPPWNKGLKGIQPYMNTSGLSKIGNPETQFKKGKVPWSKLNPEAMPRGKNHASWKGGISRAYKTGYYSVEYKQWRKAVFERDGYSCIECGACGVYVTAHHIKSFAHYPDLRFDVSNGQTLCESCHSKTDNYKVRARGDKAA